MTTSRLIAGLLGPTLVVGAISVIVNLGAWPAIIEGATRSPALVLIAGYIAFVPGLAIVYFHNRWTGGWPLLVAVMGWIILLGGVTRIVFPMQVAELGARLLAAAPATYPAVAAVLLLIGLFLSFKSYGPG
jgi:hypothetical protein